MPEAKMKNLIIASVVTATLLLCILLTMMVYQMVSIGKKEKHIDRLNGEIAALEEEKKNTQNSIEIWMKDWKIEERARELEYFAPNSK